MTPDDEEQREALLMTPEEQREALEYCDRYTRYPIDKKARKATLKRQLKALRPPVTLENAREALRYCDSYTRLPTIFFCCFPELSVEADQLPLLGKEWEHCDNFSSFGNELNGVLPPAPAFEMMTEAERVAFMALPTRLTVYRGVDRGVNELGFSWSLNRTVAERFPFFRRYQADDPVLVTATLHRNRAIALKLGRDEQEIITRPEVVRVKSVRSIARPEQLPAGT